MSKAMEGFQQKNTEEADSTTSNSVNRPPTLHTEEDDINSRDDNEVFFDACSEPSCSDGAIHGDLDNALEEAKLAISYLFNNKFDEALNLLKPRSETSMFHSMGNALFHFMEAILTFEQGRIVLAAEELKKFVDVCQNHRRKQTITESIGRKFKKKNYSQLTDVESHAELCYAEALLLKTILAIVKDETLSSLILGGIKIRSCYNSYKECAVILEQRQWESIASKVHFESGVRMGIGAFSLMISLLPSRVIKILEFIGLEGDKKTGLENLTEGSKLPGLRQILCVMSLLGYHLMIRFIWTDQGGDLELSQNILDEQLQNYPNGVWFLFFKGRLEFMKGNLDEAINWYTKSWHSQNVWKQFHQLSVWELFWVNCFKQDWRESSLHASYLLEHGEFSRTIYSYQKASALLMIEDQSPSEQQIIENLMRDVPAYKQRMSGKSLPMEKFVCKKALRYFAQGRKLCLPAIELMYVSNTFKVLSKDYHLADSVHHVVEKKLNSLEMDSDMDSDPDPYAYDNKALCLFLRGVCYRHMKKPFLALQDLEACIKLREYLKDDTYLVPYARVETGLIHAEENRTELAISILEEAKKRYTGYSMESRLQIRIHGALMDLKEH